MRNHDTETSGFALLIGMSRRCTHVGLPFPLYCLPTHGTVLTIGVIMNRHYMAILTRAWSQILREVDGAIDRRGFLRMLVDLSRLLWSQDLLAVYLFSWRSKLLILIFLKVNINLLYFHEILRM